MTILNVVVGLFLVALPINASSTSHEAILGDLDPPVVSHTTLESLPPVMRRIALCESGGRQFTDDGLVLRGAVNPDDTGYFQINRKYHLAQALKLGADIDTIEGNISYGLWLYEHHGTTDWLASKKCWQV